MGINCLNSTNTVHFDEKAVVIGASIQTLSLLAVIGISTLKPWGRRKPHAPESTTV
jgi:hypothetical protein